MTADVIVTIDPAALTAMEYVQGSGSDPIASDNCLAKVNAHSSVQRLRLIGARRSTKGQHNE
jgi:hypothetical protein